jgi:hypothetical protein
MSTLKKEFGPGYDYPNRAFNILAVILPTLLLTAVAIAAVYYYENRSTSTPTPQNVIVSCSKQLCPQPSGSSSPTAKKSASAAAIGPAGNVDALTVTSSITESSSRLAIPSPSSNLAPAGASPSAAGSTTVAAAVLASG